jgi:hypothetical protein
MAHGSLFIIDVLATTLFKDERAIPAPLFRPETFLAKRRALRAAGPYLHLELDYSAATIC